MQEGPITTLFVHNMITQENNGSSSKVPKMQYEKYSPPNYKSDLQERIRSRSFYSHKANESEERKQSHGLSVPIHKSIENGSLAREPKKIDVEFQTFYKNKDRKPNPKSTITATDYYSIMTNSMQSYMSKIEKGKKKKMEKFQRIKQFGINIQAIKSLENENAGRLFKIKKKDWSLSENNNQSKAEERKRHRRDRKEDEESGSKVEKMFSRTISVNSSTKKTNFFNKKVVLKVDKDEKSVFAKIGRMINAFSIILNSFGVRLQRPCALDEESKKNSKKIQKYTYYIGKGNNKNLIVSLLKKRWWWTEAEDITSADFVWTQLKVSTVLQKQPSMFYSDLEDINPESLKSIKRQNSDMEGSIRYIFHPMQCKRFHSKLPDREEKQYLRNMSVPSVLHNHYEANYMLGNKKALFYNICEFKGEYKKENQFQFMPLTFHIEKVKSKAYQLFQKKAKESKKSLWIVKPGENSNQGQGIFVCDSIEKVRTNIEKNKNHTFIVQKYIKNNFTFQRRKFDIRTFLLMVSIGGVKKFYWYSEGYLRTSSEIYDLTDIDDPFIHLTNDAIQINGDNYGKFEKGNKVTYHEFQRYLDINYPAEKYSVSSLVQRMKGIAKQVVQATYFKLDPYRKECSLELFGLDFLVDSHFNPWLLEVNTNPCLELSGPVLERLIPRMMENLFRIAIDPIFQPKQNDIPRNLACYIPENILERNRFELIFDSMYDRDEAWEQFSRERNVSKVYEDENEEFDSDGEIIKIED